MYAEDNAEKVIYNFGLPLTQQEISQGTYRNWANNLMSFGPPANSSVSAVDPNITNIACLTRGILNNYLADNVAVYKCPADTFLSAPQRALGWTARTRSRSMNGFFGPYTPNLSGNTAVGKNEFFSSYRQWLQVAEVPQPAAFWVTIDEQADSINNGYFLNNPASATQWGDCPAAYHNGGTSLGFVDGHAEIHKWQSPTAIPAVSASGAYSPPSFDSLGLGDYRWLMDRTAVLYQ
jgi:prepilin-type processing-associated H-X9-DG protein